MGRLETDGTSAAVIYFGGHGCVIKDRLILCPSDFRADLPHDSGIPLQHLFQTLRDRPDTRFIVLLDCCRRPCCDHEEARLGDDVPPHVTVVYSCRPGDHSYEGQDGGVLARAFEKVIRSAHRLPSLPGECLFTDVLRSIRGVKLGSFYPDFEARGGPTDEVSIPVPKHEFSISDRTQHDADSLGHDADSSPKLILTSSRIHDRQREHRFTLTLALVQKAWGMSATEINRLRCVGIRDKRVRINLPSFGIYGDPAAVVVRTARWCEILEQVEIVWGRKLSEASIRVWASQRTDNLQSMPEKKLLANWRENDRKGQVIFASGRSETTATVQCVTDRGILPLYMLKQLGPIIDTLRRL
jgi:hypothetical protein